MNDYNIYLSFQLPPSSYLKYLKAATIMLYKLPNDYNNASKYNYTIYPLLDPFNYYYCSFKPPYKSRRFRTPYEDVITDGYTQIDITSIVISWRDGSIPNNGIMITSEPGSSLILYASKYNDIYCMHPTLRLQYAESGVCPVLSCTSCYMQIDSSI